MTSAVHAGVGAEVTLWQTSLDMIATAGFDGYLTKVNPAWQEILGHTPEELMARPYAELIHPDDVARSLAEAESLTDPSYRCAGFVNRYRAKDGTYRWLSWNCRAVDGVAIYAIARDVTALHQADAERAAANEVLSERERLLDRVVENAPIGLALTALYGKVVRTNRALREITGYTDDALREMSSLQEITHPDDQQAKDTRIWVLNAIEGSTHHCQQRLLHARGKVVWVETSTSLVRDSNGDPAHVVVQMQDISERRRLEERLQQFADQDALTGMRNRRLFEDDLRNQVARCYRYKEQAALIMFDLDDFKTVNDTFGHKAGDELLKAVAAAVKLRLRTGDRAARLGGDEFAILLSNVSPEQAEVVESDVKRVLSAAQVAVGGALMSPRVSMGLAIIHGHEGDGEAVIAEADASMYAAKRAGKNTIADHPDSAAE